METLDISSSAGIESAPPAADTAAASTAQVADSNESAARAGHEVAASTETGAPRSTDDLLEEAFQKYKRAPQDEAGQTNPQTDKPQEPKEPKQEADADKADEADEAEASAEDVDPLAEFESSIPTRDDINKRFARAPKAIRDEFAETAERLTARETERAELGGDEGVIVAKAINAHLLNPQVTPDSVDAVFTTMVESNPMLVAQMGQSFIAHALDDERTGAEFGDRLLQAEFGEGYTRERLQQLVEFDRQGLLDHDALKEDLGFARTPTERERTLEAETLKLQEELKQLRGQGQDATRKEAERLHAAVDSYVSEQAMSVVTPIAEKVGWVAREGEEGPLAESKRLHGEMVSAWLEQKIKSSPHYDAVQALKETNAAFRDGQPSRALRVAMDRLREYAKATFLKAVRTQQPTYAKSFTSSPSARPSPTTTAGRSSEAQDAPPPPPRQTAPAANSSRKTVEELLEENHRRFQAHRRDAAQY